MPARALLTTLSAAGLVAAGLAVGVAIDGPAPVSGPGEPTPITPVAWQGDGLAPAESCDDLLAWHVDRAEEVVTPYGWDQPRVWFDSGVVLNSRGAAAAPSPVAGSAGLAAGSEAASDGMTNATQSGTGTNVQEAGVDEPDVAKSDGELLVRVEPSRVGGDLVVADVSGADVQDAARLDLPDVVDPELLLVGDTVVVVGRDQEAERGTEGTRVLRVDLSDPSDPVVTDTVTVDSAVLSARQHGSTVRFVLETGLPDLDFVVPGGRVGGEDAALEENLALVRATTIDDWLPHLTTYAEDGSAATTRLLPCERVGLPDDADEADGTTPGTVAVLGLDATDPFGDLDAADRVGVAVGTDLVYASVDRLYLATSPAVSGCLCRWMVDGPGRATTPDGTSELHEFVLDGTTATYTATGEVDGAIRDRWSMDEHDGVLRVAVGPTVETGNFSSILTLEDDGEGRLEEVGRVDRIGPGEDIQAVRWFGDLALVVTFRQVDPLYTVDLADPTAPEVVGELKIPGFSAYLHPLGPHRLLGVGEGPVGRGWGAQVGLFDLADLERPRRLDVLSYRPGTRHVAASDPRAFTWLPGTRTALSVVTDGWGARTGWVSVLRLDDGVLDQELVEVEHGSDVDRVRLVRLPDRRVLLVTGDDASFLEIPA